MARPQIQQHARLTRRIEEDHHFFIFCDEAVEVFSGQMIHVVLTV